MRNQGQIIFALVLVLIGVVFLIGNLLQVDTSAFCWPIGLIVIGILMIARPRMAPAGRAVEMKLLGDIRRRGTWQAMEEEIWLGIGEVNLDFTQANIPAGETHLHVWALIEDVDLTIPPGIGMAVTSTALINTHKIHGEKQDQFLMPLQWTSPNYTTAECRVIVEATSLICDLKVR